MCFLLSRLLHAENSSPSFWESAPAGATEYRSMFSSSLSNGATLSFAYAMVCFCLLCDFSSITRSTRESFLDGTLLSFAISPPNGARNEGEKKSSHNTQVLLSRVFLCSHHSTPRIVYLLLQQTRRNLTLLLMWEEKKCMRA